MGKKKLTSVQYLIEKYNVNVETKDNDGRTPINKASYCNNLDIIKYLYETCHAKITEKNLRVTCKSKCYEYIRSKL